MKIEDVETLTDSLRGRITAALTDKLLIEYCGSTNPLRYLFTSEITRIIDLILPFLPAESAAPIGRADIERMSRDWYRSNVRRLPIRFTENEQLFLLALRNFGAVIVGMDPEGVSESAAPDSREELKAAVESDDTFVDWKWVNQTLGCDCVPEEGQTCDFCALRGLIKNLERAALLPALKAEGDAAKKGGNERE